MRLISVARISVLSVTLVLANTGFAEEDQYAGLEEVVVTAQKR